MNPSLCSLTLCCEWTALGLACAVSLVDDISDGLDVYMFLIA